MLELNLSRWGKVWLSKPWELRGDPATGMMELNGVRGYLVPGDIAYLFNLAAELPEGGCYLEVGSFMGLSALVFANGLLANLNLRATAFCVDTWGGSPEHQALPEVQSGSLFDLFLRNINEAQMGCLVRPVRGASAEVARGWNGPPLDIVFIDGDHAAEACYQDIRAWTPRLKRGGRLLGHDAAPGSGVEQALLRYCSERGCVASVIDLPASHYVWEIHTKNAPVPPGRRLLT